MKRGRVLAAVCAMLGLPLLLAGADAARFYAANRDRGSITSGGWTRGFVLYVPRSYDSTRPTPLVISLHGAGLWGAAQREISQWDRIADREGFIVVYPTALLRGIRVWNNAEENGIGRDVRFIGDLIDTLSARYNIDRSRVYANGLSNGGGMSFVLSCRMPDRIAAVGMVGPALLYTWQSCNDTNAVPAIAIHGTADKFARYNGGVSWVARDKPFAGIVGWMRAWAQRNRCAPTPNDARVATDVVKREYTGCRAPVVLYTIEGGGHTWPGGGEIAEWFAGPTSHSIDASAVMWDFFRGQSTRSAAPASDPRATPAAPGRNPPPARRARAARPTPP